MVSVLNHKRSVVPKLAALSLLLGFSAANNAQAVTLFSENFEGYTSFPNYDPFLDPVNSGIAKLSEGAQQTWYGARFEGTDTLLSTYSTQASIDADLAIQQFGGLPILSTNTTHTGRVADDAGMLFKINTVGYTNVNLSFDWRTYKAETTDRIVVGYHVGAISDFGADFAGSACAGNGESGCYADLRSGANSWTSGWTELMRDSASYSWNSENLALAAGQSEVWVAFWMDNGNGDYAKFDNVLVTATPVPEADTYAMLLAGLGLVGYTVSRRKRSFS